jgi:hypothetical protein
MSNHRRGVSDTDGWFIYHPTTIYNKTIASDARYGDILTEKYGNEIVIAEDSEASYSGHAKVLFLLFDEDINKYYIKQIGWSYGSCSGCDGWEADETPGHEILKEMEDNSDAYFNEPEQLTRLSKMLSDTNQRSAAEVFNYAAKVLSEANKSLVSN